MHSGHAIRTSAVSGVMLRHDRSRLLYIHTVQGAIAFAPRCERVATRTPAERSPVTRRCVRRQEAYLRYLKRRVDRRPYVCCSLPIQFIPNRIPRPFGVRFVRSFVSLVFGSRACRTKPRRLLLSREWPHSAIITSHDSRPDRRHKRPPVCLKCEGRSRTSEKYEIREERQNQD